MKLYVASSWRHDYQPDVVFGCREAGHEVYDFRNPSDGDHGFHWSHIDPGWQSWSVRTYVKKLKHPLAESGFNKDFEAMQFAQGCVLLPGGRSSHLEAGWFVGVGRPLWILKSSDDEPELMYKMANGIYGGMGEMLLAIQDWEDEQGC